MMTVLSKFISKLHRNSKNDTITPNHDAITPDNDAITPENDVITPKSM